MGFWQDNTVEVTYNGKTTRVAKSDAHLYKTKEVTYNGKTTRVAKSDAHLYKTKEVKKETVKKEK